MITLIIITGLMLGIGSSSLIAISSGQKDKKLSQHYLETMIVGSILIGFLIMIVRPLFRDSILKMLGKHDTVMPYAQDYFTIFLLYHNSLYFFHSLKFNCSPG